MELVGFDEIGAADAIELHELIEEHHLRTLSPVAARILEDWDAWLPHFVKVMPHDYKRALQDMAKAERAMRADAERGRGRPPRRRAADGNEPAVVRRRAALAARPAPRRAARLRGRRRAPPVPGSAAVLRGARRSTA